MPQTLDAQERPDGRADDGDVSPVRTVQLRHRDRGDLRSRIRVGNRIQLTTDGFTSYPPVVDSLWRNGIDYGVIVKEYGTAPGEERRYSAATCLSEKKYVVCGKPDKSKISASYVERQNLTMRMNIRRFTRLTNGFSKRVENHAHATALHFAYYNLVRPHQTLSGKGRGKVTPAMPAGSSVIRGLCMTSLGCSTATKPPRESVVLVAFRVPFLNLAHRIVSALRVVARLTLARLDLFGLLLRLLRHASPP